MGGEFTDLHINAAQKILKIQFPEINGLESTLYQMKEKYLTEDSTKNKIQIIHCAERNHWIVATNVGCEGKDLLVVKVYDSIFHSVDTETRKVIINSFQTSDAKIDIRVIGSQKQKGDHDCGLFAIGHATSIAFGHKPEKQIYKQERMRAHLVNCFHKQTFSLFP